MTKRVLLLVSIEEEEDGDQKKRIRGEMGRRRGWGKWREKGKADSVV